jgi:preprotein translocase subunit SecD
VASPHTVLRAVLLAALALAVSGAAGAQPPEIRFEAGADVLTLDRRDIASAEIPAGYTAYISGAQDVVPLLIRFTPPVAAELESLTARHVGETIFILIDGALVSQPVVREAIDTGGVIITNLDRGVAEGVLASVGPPAPQGAQ